MGGEHPDDGQPDDARRQGRLLDRPIFAATSGASPIITGLCLLIQNLQILLTPKPGQVGRLGPATMRAILANPANGTAVQSSFGPMPDGAKIIANEYVGP